MTTETPSRETPSRWRRFFLPLLAVVFLLFGVWSAMPSDDGDDTHGTTDTPQRPLSESPPPSTPVDVATLFLPPLCLDYAREVRQGAGFWCDPALEAHEVTAREPRSGTWYWSDRPRTEEDWSSGSIGYRVAKQWSGEEDGTEVAVLEISDHGGGTGRFARLEVIERRDDGRLRIRHRILAGDRCNDGFIELDTIDDDAIVYRTAATPFRLLNPRDDNDWRTLSRIRLMAGDAIDDLDFPETLLDWQPYEDIIHCAACCAGQVVHRHDLGDDSTHVVGVRVDDDAFTRGAARDAETAECLRAWSEGLQSGDGVSIRIGAWIWELGRLARACGHVADH